MYGDTYVVFSFGGFNYAQVTSFFCGGEGGSIGDTVSPTELRHDRN